MRRFKHTHTHTLTHTHTHTQLLNMFNVQGEAELACVCYDAQIIIIEEGGAGYEPSRYLLSMAHLDYFQSGDHIQTWACQYRKEREFAHVCGIAIE